MKNLYDKFINVRRKQYAKIFGNDANAIKTNHQYLIKQIKSKYSGAFTYVRIKNVLIFIKNIIKNLTC